MLNVKKAAVLGAGTMGAAIAAHLSNAGIPTLLLGHCAERIIARTRSERLAARRAAGSLSYRQFAV